MDERKRSEAQQRIDDMADLDREAREVGARAPDVHEENERTDPIKILRWCVSCTVGDGMLSKREEDIADINPNLDALRQLDLRGVIATAEGKDVDFVSRYFAPKVGINEDPVTGSTHCMLTPYWADRLNKLKLKARQLSKRTGELECELQGDRVLISGRAVLYLEGKIWV